MRLRELSLLAYGPFSGTSLDLSAGGLHIVFGRNEAGKSTALRAVTGLLFGIDAKTGDAHVHAMKDLRVGAVLEDEHGQRLRVVRRKGAQNTLLDAQGKAIDEAPLRRMLAGVDAALFKKMFGLNHETLRDGGEALALGQGDVGESLFGASLGGEVHEVLKGLAAEGDALFAPSANATRPLVNAALRAFAEAQKKVRALSDVQGIAVQQQGLDEAIAERAACEKEKRSALTEASRVRRARDVRPLLAKRAVLVARRAELGNVVILPESAARDREAAEQSRAEAEVREARLAREEAELAAARAAIAVPEAFVEREAEVDELAARTLAHRKAAAELPRVRAELASATDEVRALLARMRRPLDVDAAEALPIDPARQAKAKKLALAHAGLEERARKAERDALAKTRALEERREELARVADVPDGAALRRAAARAQPHGDVDERVRRAAVEATRRREASEALLAGLAPYRGTLDEARVLPVPVVETVERFAQRAAQRERTEAKLAELAEANAQRAAQVARELDALDRAGAVPTEEGLAAARARRDDAFRALAARWDSERARVYEALVADADTLADRLRREADRVARRASLEAEHAACAAEAERLAASRAELEVERAKTDAEWRATWEAAAIEPLPPAEMRAWLERHAKLRASIEELRAAEAEHARLAEDARALRAGLVEALAASGERGAEGEDVAALLARAAERGRALDEALRARSEGERAIAALAREAEDAARERSEAAAALEAWREAWGREVVALGLAADASPEEATTLLDDMGELARALEETRRARRRVAALERDEEAFAADVASLVATHAPDLAGQPAEAAAAALVKRQQQAREARGEQRRLDALLEEKRAALAEQREKRAIAAARLAALVQAAGVADAAALDAAERASASAREVDAQLRSVEERLAELGHHGGEDEADPLAALDEAALEARADELAQKLEELDQRHRTLERTIGGLEQGLAQIRAESAAAQAASEAQEHLARARAAAERYARVRLAEVLLGREIERYRERHQGPVLARAGALLARMTLGAFTGLRVGYGDDDQPVLRAVRAAPLKQGGDVDAAVNALSDGTRDQLYLALRLATLERFAETSAPLPLVVDDILVHFDDDRARAALHVLGEVSARMQVLLFTHHARVVELAQGALAGAVHVHTLGAPQSSAPAPPAPPAAPATPATHPQASLPGL